MSDTPIQELQKYIHGVHYPSRRELVVEAARRNGAPADTIERLNHLLPRVAGPHEVLIALRQPPNDSSYLSQNRFRTGPGLGRASS